MFWTWKISVKGNGDYDFSFNIYMHAATLSSKKQLQHAEPLPDKSCTSYQYAVFCFLKQITYGFV